MTAVQGILLAVSIVVFIYLARRKQITQIVVGSSQRSRWRQLMGGGSTVRKILRLADAEDIDVHVIARRHGPRPTTPGLADEQAEDNVGSSIAPE